MSYVVVPQTIGPEPIMCLLGELPPLGEIDSKKDIYVWPYRDGRVVMRAHFKLISGRTIMSVDEFLASANMFFINAFMAAGPVYLGLSWYHDVLNPSLMDPIEHPISFDGTGWEYWLGDYVDCMTHFSEFSHDVNNTIFPCKRCACDEARHAYESMPLPDGVKKAADAVVDPCHHDKM